jgi:hypothetical protein
MINVIDNKFEKEIDYDLLKSCIKFPLKVDDYGGYIWDDNNDMIAQFNNDYRYIFSDRIGGEIRFFENEEDLGLFTIDTDLVFHSIKYPLNEVGCVRGWGHLQYKYNKKKGTKKYDPEGGAKRQDNLSIYLLKCLNTPKKKEYE